MKFSSILIVNRGEIACRIIHTASYMGLRTIAVYSDADKDALHVKLADEAVHIGASPAVQSYLDIEKILGAAKQTGAEAIHPGYGFLSENADFVRACDKAGLVFIGPPPDAMEIMGDKAKAKRAMMKADVICIPGYHGADQSPMALRVAAKSIGFPLMVKAAAGGGGMGMRLVADLQDFEAATAQASSEAGNAFGNGDLILEKAMSAARHIEVQIFADTHGNTIHIGERDCSVQRRHQKVIEEAPAPGLSKKLRAAMGAAAVKVAQAVNYVGAGTVEFLVDGDDFFFLEMNTRLQVEHAVTESITGDDLVEMQINVAQGFPLSLSQGDVQFYGHAIEARIYAEDPDAGFLPSSGRVDIFAADKMVRVDTGIASGSNVPADYDPLIAKIIAHGDSREIARSNLLSALQNTALFGLTTNIGFLTQVLRHADYIDGGVDTSFITAHKDQFLAPNITPDKLAQAIAIQFDIDFEASCNKALFPQMPPSHWASATMPTTPFHCVIDADTYVFNVKPNDVRDYQVQCGDNIWHVILKERSAHEAHLNIDGRKQSLFYHGVSPSHLQIGSAGQVYDIHFQNKMFALGNAEQNDGQVLAPMHGNLAEIFVKTRDVIRAGEPLAILEAMKMRHEITAMIDGIVEEIFANAGEQISSGAPILTIKPKAET